MKQQIQLEKQVLRLGREDFEKLCELEREVEGYFEKNFAGITLYFSQSGLEFQYGGAL